MWVQFYVYQKLYSFFSVKANIIHPATQKHIEKYTMSPSHLGNFLDLHLANLLKTDDLPYIGHIFLSHFFCLSLTLSFFLFPYLFLSISLLIFTMDNR